MDVLRGLPFASPIPRLLTALGLTAALLITAPGARAAAPGNDDRSAAIPVTLFGYGTVDLTEATRAPDDLPPCNPSSTEYGTVWYAYTAQEAGTLRIAFGAVDDTAAIHVLGPDGSQLTCDEQPSRLKPPVGGGDYVEIDAVAGSTYLIELTTVSATAPWSAGITIDLPAGDAAIASVSEGELNAAGDATFQLGLACPASLGYFEILIEVTQRTPDGTIGANGDHPGANCSRESAVNSAEIVARDGWREVDGKRVFDDTYGLVPGPASMRIGWAFVTPTETRRLVETRAVELVGGPRPTPVVTAPPTSTIDPVRPSASPDPVVAAAILAGLPSLLLLLLGARFRRRRPDPG